MSDITIQASALRELARELLESTGLEKSGVQSTVQCLVDASLRGVDSHGIRLLPHYLDAIEGGRLNRHPNFAWEATGPSLSVLDADHAIGFSAGDQAIDHCIRLTRETGLAVVAVRNSSHCGMLSYYTMRGARAGFMALAATNTTPRLIPPLATQPFFGTNPLSYAFPTAAGEPLCYDSATTMITGNKIKLHRTLGKPLPEGVAADSNGIPTTDPHAAEYLAAFGGYKGFGIAMLVDILCGALTGMPNGDQVSKMYGGDLSEHRQLGHFFLVLDPSRFNPAFIDQLTEELDRLRSIPTTEGGRVIAPGDLELQSAAERLEKGIPISPEVLEQLNQAAASRGVDPLSLRATTN